MSNTDNVQTPFILQDICPKSIQANKPPVHIRVMASDEAIGVVMLMHQCYGATYFYQDLYSAAKIAELNCNGAMKSIVAVNEEEEIVGHMTIFNNETIGAVALTGMRDNSELGEPAMLMVHPAYRNQGILARMMQFALAPDSPCTQGLNGLFCPPITDHIFSQLAMYRYGFSDCGYLLDYYPSAKIEGLSESLKGRTSLVLTYLKRGHIIERNIYPPENHMAMILEIYSHLNLSPRLGQFCASGEIESKSIIETTMALSLSNATIKLLVYGNEIVERLSNELNILRSKNIKSIILYMSLSDPQTSVWAKEIELLGFHFAGILPQTSIGDILILQYFDSNVSPDIPRMASKHAERIFAYIKKSIDDRISMLRIA